MTDWEEIRNEFIEECVSLRELAQRHGLKYETVKYHSRKEGWNALRRQRENADGSRRVEQVSIKLLRRLEKAIDEDGDSKDIKAMAGALKELRDIQQRGEGAQEDSGRTLEVCFMGDSGELSQ